MKRDVLYFSLLLSFLAAPVAFAAHTQSIPTGNEQPPGSLQPGEQSVSDQAISPHRSIPSVAIETSPLSFLLFGYNFGLQFPLHSQLTIGPKITLYRFNGENFQKTGSQIGVRAQYFLQSDWHSSGMFLKGGFFRDHYAERGSLHLLRDGTAKGLMADLLFGGQFMANSRFGLSASLGIESSNWKNDENATGLFEKREGRTITPVVELSLSFTL